MKLAQVFDPRNNALNVWRLVLASGVILEHSWPLTDRKLRPPFDQLISQVWVDGFFVISGFLITASSVYNLGFANTPPLVRFASFRGCGSACSSSRLSSPRSPWRSRAVPPPLSCCPPRRSSTCSTMRC